MISFYLDPLKVITSLDDATKARRITVTFTLGVEIVLQFDALWPTLETVKRTSKHVTVSVTVYDALLMLDDLMQRSSPVGGYDQPLSWVRSSGINAERLYKTLQAENIIPRRDA